MALLISMLARMVVNILEVIQHKDRQMTSGTGVACRWCIELNQQGTDNSGGLWFTLWSL